MCTDQLQPQISKKKKSRANFWLVTQYNTCFAITKYLTLSRTWWCFLNGIANPPFGNIFINYATFQLNTGHTSRHELQLEKIKWKHT